MKRYCIVQVEELRKRYADSTQASLKSDGWNSNGVSIDGLALSFKDALCPDLGQKYIVTFEPIVVPEGQHISDFGKKIIEELEEQETAKILPNTGRKFR